MWTSNDSIKRIRSLLLELRYTCEMGLKFIVRNSEDGNVTTVDL